MPRVPTYGLRNVATKPLPGARLTNVPSPNAFGAQFGAALGAVSGQFIANVLREEREAADQLVLLEAENKLARAENTLLYGGDGIPGLLSREGKNAFGVPEEFDAEYAKVVSGVSTNLTNDRQRQEFARLVAARGQSAQLQLHRHVFDERQKFDTAETNAFLDNSVNSAVEAAGQNEIVEQHLNAGLYAISQHAIRSGMGVDQKEALEEAYTTKVHEGVINKLIAMNQDRQAQIYYEEAKEQISGPVQTRLMKTLEEGSLRGESQRRTDAIMLEAETPEEALAMGREIEDPKLRDAVRDRLRQRISDDIAMEHATTEQNLKESADLIEAGQGLDAIPENIWANYTLTQRNGLRKLHETLNSAAGIETDWVFFAKMIEESEDDEKAFATRHLIEDRWRLDDQRFVQLLGIQAAVKRGMRGGQIADYNDSRTERQVIDGVLARMGLDPSPDVGTEEQKQIALFRQIVGDRVIEEKIAQNKERLSNTEIQAIADEVITAQVTNKIGLASLAAGFLAGIAAPPSRLFGTRGGAGFFLPEVKRLVDLTIQDVPAGAQKEIRDQLAEFISAASITDEMILQTFISRELAKRR